MTHENNNMRRIVYAYYILLLLCIVIFSYGFKDPNLTLTSSPFLISIFHQLTYVVYGLRPLATLIFISILLGLWSFYIVVCKNGEKLFTNIKHLAFFIILSAFILSFSYPALTHDLFNYVTTAKVTFTHGENPYVVMPIEIPNEPYLAFTRAANKYALYGPIWILITAIPHYLGNNNIWQTIIMFKLLNAIIYLVFVYMIYKITKSLKNTLFFAFNPLILIETLISGHNDIYMMLFACFGLVILKQYKFLGALSFLVSVLIKGATFVLTPLLFIKNISFEQILVFSYWLLALIFFIAAPIREELYPWYAVWLVCIVSFLPMKKYVLLYGFTTVLTFALELRHLPYMWMGYYEGPGPTLRFLLTIIPIAIYIVVFFVKRLGKRI